MSHNVGGGGGVDFSLPDEILSVIPTDPYDQLDLARKITSMAIASRVSKLEAEAGRLRQKVGEKDRVIEEFEDRIAELERMLKEADARLRLTVEENVKLTRERDTLAVTARKLSRDLSKLETFKKQLMQSLSEDHSPHALVHHPTGSARIDSCDQYVPKSSTWKEGEPDEYDSTNHVIGSNEIGKAPEEASSGVGEKYWPAPYITPRLTPNVTPKIISSSSSPRGLSTAVSPKVKSGTTSPTKPRIDGKNILSPWYPSSQQSSAANSPPRSRNMPGRTPRIDGKEFFRQARSRLSYEQFGAFLANIKELNAHRQSREETLRRAEEIFGIDNKDLYLLFQSLLSRNMP